MALSSVLPSLSSPPPCTAAAMLNSAGTPSSTPSSVPSSSGRLICSPISYTVAYLPFLRQPTTSLSYTRRRSHIVRMAPEEEKMTRRSPVDFPIEWERPKPGRRPDIIPQFSPMKTPLPPPMPSDPPPHEDEEEEEEEEEEKEEEEKENEENPDDPDKPQE